MPSEKTAVIEELFVQRWDPAAQVLTNSTVMLADVGDAIRAYNSHRPQRRISDRNPANFFKDFIRNSRSANANWPSAVFALGYAARQRTGGGRCFEFTPVPTGQVEPFPSAVPPLAAGAPRHRVESVSLPLASRLLGRDDEAWLIQVLVRLRVFETHLALYSPRRGNIKQVDHLQMSVKLREAEIDAIFLVLEQDPGGTTARTLVTCEAKQSRDDILEGQILAQLEAVAAIPDFEPDLVAPMAAKSVGDSTVHLVEFAAVSPTAIRGGLTSLAIASEQAYTFEPPVPGIR